MKVFNNYAQYYDVLYQDKNYKKEVLYLDSLIKKYGKGRSKTILELGSGTGLHAKYLSQLGYNLHGIDISDSMLVIAQNNNINIHNISFTKGDVRSYRHKAKFDIVLSIFHVINYQITSEDLISMFKTASYHLENGGVFIFDFWFGPAVEEQQPSISVKRAEDENLSITRITEPNICIEKHIVDVCFTCFIKDKKTNLISDIYEKHRLRYLFEKEIKNLFEDNNFTCLSLHEWFSFNNLSKESWKACAVGIKR